MKIHHTIHVPKGYDRLDDLKRCIAEKFPSGLHDFTFEEAEVERPKWHATDAPDRWKGVSGEGMNRKYHLSDYGVKDFVKDYASE